MARLFDDGASQYLKVDTPAVLGAPLTMACWYFSDSLLLNQALMVIADTAGDADFFMLFLFGDTGGDPVVAAINATVGGWDSAAGTLTAYAVNTWEHAAAVYVSSTERWVYKNGSDKDGSTADRTPAGLDTTSIGNVYRQSPIWGLMSGRIALPAIWDCALSDAEVLWLAQGNWPHRVRPSNFCGYWLPPGIRNDRDYSGRGYHMTPYNGPTWAADPPKVLTLR